MALDDAFLVPGSLAVPEKINAHGRNCRTSRTMQEGTYARNEDAVA